MSREMIRVVILVIGFGLRIDSVLAMAGDQDLLCGLSTVDWPVDYKCIVGDTLVRWPGNYNGVAVVPPEVVKIGDNAFVSCKGVTGVKFMGPVKEVGREAFMFCDELGEMEIPSTVTNIGVSAFHSCRSLTNLLIRSRMTKLPDGMCEKCFRLSRVEFEEGLRDVGEDAFASCRSLPRLVLPIGVENIGARAFSGCASLREIELPPTIRKIGKNAFLGCYDLNVVSANSLLAAEVMKLRGATSRGALVADENGLKAAIKIASNGFASKHTVADEVRFGAMDAFASYDHEICVGTESVDLERCIKLSGASKTVSYGGTGIEEIDVDFGMYEGDFIEIRMKIVEGKVSNIELNETLKKGVRLGLGLCAETSEGKVLNWL